MIIKLDKSNLNLINKVELIFNNLKQQNIDILNDFEYNPYTNYLIYLIDDNPVAYINYNIIFDRYEIINFYVLNEYRGIGIGSKLIKEVIDSANDDHAVNITLEVKKDNFIAINLYKKNGFVEKAIREKYYFSTDGILMEKEMIK